MGATELSIAVKLGHVVVAFVESTEDPLKRCQGKGSDVRGALLLRREATKLQRQDSRLPVQCGPVQCGPVQCGVL